jgi:hypothetical protein
MKRKNYERPTMKVVKLQHQSHILVASNGDAGVQDYHKQSDADWDNE